MRLLMSGGTGRLGTALVEEVTSRAMTADGVLRSQGARTAPGRWSRLGATGTGHHGDVTTPLWGMATGVDELVDVDVVVNLAAETRWGASAAAHYRTNLLGAVNGMELAAEVGRRSGRPIVYCHVSSVFVAGSRTGYVPETDHGADGRRTDYEHTKWLAEVRLRHLARRLPEVRLAIVRLGGIVGRHPARPFSSSTLELLDVDDNLVFGRVPYWTSGRVDVLERTEAARWLADYLEAVVGEPDTDIPPFVHLCAGTSAPTLRAVLEAARWSCPNPKRLLPLPDRSARWLRSSTLRTVPLSSKRKTLLDGMKHVAEDRVFERHRLHALLGGLPAAPPVDRLAELVFGRSEVPERFAPSPLGMGMFTV